MGYFELLNPPVEFTLAGVTFKARKAGTSLLASCCAKVVSDELAIARELAQGLDESLRAFFLVNAVRRISSGAELEAKAMKWQGSRAGEVFCFAYWLKEFHPDLTEKDIAVLLAKTPTADRIALIEMLFDL